MPHREPSSGIEIRPLATVEQVFAAAAVLREVWGGDRDAVPTNLMIALAHAGNYVVGMYDGDRVVGASIAFFAAPESRSMHSHITGLLADHQGRGLGRELKQHQRDWALRRGIGHLTWTFDPLIARNAHFNLAVLGARAVEYGTDFYGPMDDGRNRGDESDRIVVSWALAAPPAPTPAPADVVATVAVPADVEALRLSDPPAAAAWRVRVRAELRAHLDAGLAIGGFADGAYLLVRG